MAKKATTVQTPGDSRETFVSIRKSFAEGGDIKEKLQTLYSLQLVDTELEKIYQLRGELPAEVTALEAKIAELNGKAANVAQEIMDNEKKVAELKQQYAQTQDMKAKYEAQMESGVENSRQFDSLQKEIENQNLLGQVALKRIGETEQAIEALKQDLDSIGQRIEVRNEDLVAKKEELSTIATSTAKQEEKLLESRKEYASLVDARTMSAYERIRKSVRNHIAIAAAYYVDDKRSEASCGGCYSKIPPQRLIDVQTGKKLIICEYCGRILVDAKSEN